MTQEYARYLDERDELKHFREEFFLPEANGKSLVYFCGNSLGLQPKKVREYMEAELQSWAAHGVEGHFHGKRPWLHYHKNFSRSLARLTGAKATEVVAANTLTTNLHLMLTSFYRPAGKRFKIITEAGSFSSDIYALSSQVALHGLNPKKAIIEVKPRKGEYTLRTEDILTAIGRHRNELSLVMMGGVNYYTGQALDMELITKGAHKAGAKAGFDLAHAIGNIPLELHKWDVDFAVWCSYKYLNSGPGATGGLFVHERHAKNKKIPRLAGWWGHEEKTRFKMKPGFKPVPTAEGWQLSNAQIFNMVAHRASLDIFDQAGMKALVKKSRALNLFMEDLIRSKCKKKDGYKIKLITPASVDERGCQLSVMVSKNGEDLFKKITAAGFVVDWRSPNVIRVSPVPLYNTFEEVYDFVSVLAQWCYCQ